VSQLCVKISTEFFILDGLTSRVRLRGKNSYVKGDLLANGGFRRNQPLTRLKLAPPSFVLSHGGRDTSLYSDGTQRSREDYGTADPPPLSLAVWILRRGIMATHSEVIWKGISSLDNTESENP